MQPGTEILRIDDRAEVERRASLSASQLPREPVRCGCRAWSFWSNMTGQANIGGNLADADWTDEENDLIVEDYFHMLAMELADVPFVKAHHRRTLLKKLRPIRSEGSIEFKHQNISAVMLGLGQPRIDGYKPASQFQMSLVDAVLRRMSKCADWEKVVAALKQESSKSGIHAAEPASLWFGPPPTHANEPPPIDSAVIAAIGRKFDVAERDERNRALGEAGERLVLDHERITLISRGRSDLAAKVRWTSKEIGDGSGFDIESFDVDGSIKLIEVKTTNGWERTPFHISRNELIVAEENRDRWHLYRIWNMIRAPKAFSIRPPLQAHVSLTPTSFLASLH